MTINGNQIEKLITRFYYKQKQLYFQIVLELGMEQQKVYQEYNDFKLYKQDFSRLLTAKSRAQDIQVPV